MLTPDREVLSPNVNRFPNGTPIPMPRECATVIVHATRSGIEGHSDEAELASTLNWFRIVGMASSHWVISRAGELIRCVADTEQAWHAAEDNDNAWGVELVQAVEADGFTDVQIEALVRLGRAYVRETPVYAVHVRTSAGPGFIGHQETRQGRTAGKSDPGALFPWDAFIDEIQRPPAPPQPAGIGVHYTDGTAEEVWTPREGKTLDGIGYRLDNGEQRTLWTPGG